MLAKPSLPEPEGPPPPPPIQNGYAFNTPHINQDMRNNSKLQKPQVLKKKKPKDPIYESIKPRPGPLGGLGGTVNGGNEVLGEEYGFTCPANQLPNTNQQPLKQLSNNVPNGAGEEYGFTRQDKQSTYGFSNSSRIYGTSRGQQKPRVVSAALEAEREARRMVRVRRELERIQELNEDENKENDGGHE